MVRDGETRAKTVHELSSNSFNRSPDGSVFTHDLKTVFSIMIISLSLDDSPKNKTSKLFQFGKTSHPYTFLLSQAVEMLKNLTMTVEMNSTSIHISYAIKPELGFQLVRSFMEAKLLHTPADRTRSRPKDGILLQPTAKGVAVACEHARNMALKDLPPILTSNFNSMSLFKFERNSMDDSIIHSEYFITLLFTKLMGPRPNVWSPKNPTEKLPKLSSLLENRNEDVFTFENISFDQLLQNECQNTKDTKNDQSVEHNSSLDISPEQLEDENRVSPFAHKFFSNPDSDSHVQYYVSDCGMRLFKDKSFGKKETVVDYCFTTKALWQWLMECTDIMYPREAVSIAALFLKHGLIVPIMHPPSQNSKKKFIISKNCYYTMSKGGWDIIQWSPSDPPKPFFSNDLRQTSYLIVSASSSTQESNVKLSLSSNCNTDVEFNSASDEDIYGADGARQLTLKQVLADPGIRYLFRAHLSKDMCAENLDVYVEITKFLKRMSVLRKLLQSRDQNNDNQLNLFEWKANGSTKLQQTLRSALLKHTNECLSMVYHIYSSYIAAGAPYQLNIDHHVRESVTKIIFNPKSPTTPKFGNNIGFFEGGSKSEAIVSEFTSTSDESSSDLKHKERHEMIEKKSLDDESFSSTPVSFYATPITHKTESCLIEHTINMLKELYVHLEGIRNSVYVMMKNDSMPKFLATDSYKEVRSLISNSK